MMKRVLTVGCRIPGGFGEYVNFDSKASLLDADFVLFCPPFWLPNENPRQTIDHWRRALEDVLDAGNSVFVLLSDYREVSLGQSNVVANYDALPYPIAVVRSTGTSMTLSRGQSILGDYWQQFGAESRYLVHMAELNDFDPLVVTRHGDRVVGAIHRAENGSGALVALPWISLDREEFAYIRDESDNGDTWSNVAVEWGRRYFETLRSLDDALKFRDSRTPTPLWAQSDAFKTGQEITLSEELGEIQGRITGLVTKRAETEAKIARVASLTSLLFEQGHELEGAVLQAMSLMGFEANSYRDADSEFDAVLECPEGRCIGEVEGRDNKAIGIDKMRQLEVNILEDFERDEVAQLAKGVLFGNAFRLTSPSDRPTAHFTEKCMTAAERNGTALIRTCDLYEVAKALADNTDPDFAAACRRAILNAHGKEVEFPLPPESGPKNLRSESHQSGDTP